LDPSDKQTREAPDLARREPWKSNTEPKANEPTFGQWGRHGERWVPRSHLILGQKPNLKKRKESNFDTQHHAGNQVAKPAIKS